MSLFFLDKVSIIPVTNSDAHGTKTLGAAVSSKAYMELEDQLHRGLDGTPLKPTRLVLLPKRIAIHIGDLITLTKRSGVTVAGDDAVRREVTKVFTVRGVVISHKEVTTTSGRL